MFSVTSCRPIGINVAGALGRIEATGIPLLAFTVFDIGDYIHAIKEAGFGAVCRKPAELTELEAIIFKPLDQEAVGDFQVVPATPPCADHSRLRAGRSIVRRDATR